MWHGETSKKNPMKSSSSSCRLFGSHSRQVLAWHHSNLLFQDLSQAGSWAVCPFDLTCQGATSHNQLANDRDRQSGACEPCWKKWIAYYHWTTANVQSFPGDQQKICCGVLQVSDWIVWHDSASYVHWRLIEIASFPNTSQRTDKWQLGPFSSPPCLVHEFQIYRCNPFKSSLFLHVKRQDPDTIFTIPVWSSVVFYNFLSQYSFSLSLSLPLYSMSTYKHHICHICHRRSAGDSPNPSRCRWFHHCSERCGRSGAGRWSASRGWFKRNGTKPVPLGQA